MELRNNPQVVLSAVQHDGSALRFASPTIRGVLNIVPAAVNQMKRKVLMHAQRR